MPVAVTAPLRVAAPTGVADGKHADVPASAEHRAAGETGGGTEPLAGPVPEPGALFLVGTGLVGVALTARRRKRRTKQQ